MKSAPKKERRSTTTYDFSDADMAVAAASDPFKDLDVYDTFSLPLPTIVCHGLHVDKDSYRPIGTPDSVMGCMEDLRRTLTSTNAFVFADNASGNNNNNGMGNTMSVSPCVSSPQPGNGSANSNNNNNPNNSSKNNNNVSSSNNTFTNSILIKTGIIGNGNSGGGVSSNNNNNINNNNNNNTAFTNNSINMKDSSLFTSPTIMNVSDLGGGENKRAVRFNWILPRRLTQPPSSADNKTASTDANSGLKEEFRSNRAILNLLIYSITETTSRPRALLHVAKRWRDELVKMNNADSCLIVLYATNSAEFTKSKIEAVCDKYISELRTLKFYAPQQVIVLSGDSAASGAKLRGRVVQQLRMCYTMRTELLSGVFRNYLESKRTLPLDPTLRNPVNRQAGATSPAGGGATSGGSPNVPTSWSIIKMWRYGYDLAMHYLRYGQCRSAASVFQRLFLEYYNNSDEYGFVTKRQTLDRLGRDTSLLQPTSGGSEGYHTLPQDSRQDSKSGNGTASNNAKNNTNNSNNNTNTGASASIAYPRQLALGAEIIDGLLLIVTGEMSTYLLLNRDDLARERFQSFVQVAKEKFEDINQMQDRSTSITTMERISVAHQHFFLLQCYLSALRLFWPSYRITRKRTAEEHARTATAGSETGLEASFNLTGSMGVESFSFTNNSLFLTDNTSFARNAITPFGGPDASQQYSLLSPFPVLTRPASASALAAAVAGEIEAAAARTAAAGGAVATEGWGATSSCWQDEEMTMTDDWLRVLVEEAKAAGLVPSNMTHISFSGLSAGLVSSNHTNNNNNNNAKSDDEEEENRRLVTALRTHCSEIAVFCLKARASFVYVCQTMNRFPLNCGIAWSTTAKGVSSLTPVSGTAGDFPAAAASSSLPLRSGHPAGTPRQRFARGQQERAADHAEDFDNVIELATPGCVLHFWRVLTIMAMAAYKLGGQQRLELNATTQLAVSYLEDAPVQAARIVSHRLLPLLSSTSPGSPTGSPVRKEADTLMLMLTAPEDHRLSASRYGEHMHIHLRAWSHISRVIRQLHVFGVHRTIQCMLAKKPERDGNEHRIELLTSVFHSEVEYMRYKESMMFLLKHAENRKGSGGGGDADSTTAALDTCIFDAPALYGTAHLWDRIISVDRLVAAPLFAGHVPLYPLQELLLAAPMLYIVHDTSDAARRQGSMAYLEDKRKRKREEMLDRVRRRCSMRYGKKEGGGSSGAGRDLPLEHVELDDTIQLFFEASCCVDILRGTDLTADSVASNADCPSMGNVKVTAVLESQKDWSDKTEATHVVTLHADLTQCTFDSSTCELRCMFTYQCCHSGLHRLRYLMITNHDTHLVFYPPRPARKKRRGGGGGVGGSADRAACTNGTLADGSTSDNDDTEDSDGEDSDSDDSDASDPAYNGTVDRLANDDSLAQTLPGEDHRSRRGNAGRHNKEKEVTVEVESSLDLVYDAQQHLRLVPRAVRGKGRRRGAPPPPANTLASVLDALCSEMLFAVREPRSGAKVHVQPPTDEHYFADAPPTFRVNIDLDPSIFQLTNAAATTAAAVALGATGTGTGNPLNRSFIFGHSRYSMLAAPPADTLAAAQRAGRQDPCAFEAGAAMVPLSQVPPSPVAGGVGEDTSPPQMATSLPAPGMSASFRHETMAGTVMAMQEDAAALAFLVLSPARRGVSHVRLSRNHMVDNGSMFSGTRLPGASISLPPAHRSPSASPYAQASLSPAHGTVARRSTTHHGGTPRVTVEYVSVSNSNLNVSGAPAPLLQAAGSAPAGHRPSSSDVVVGGSFTSSHLNVNSSSNNNNNAGLPVVSAFKPFHFPTAVDESPTAVAAAAANSPGGAAHLYRQVLTRAGGTNRADQVPPPLVTDLVPQGASNEETLSGNGSPMRYPFSPPRPQPASPPTLPQPTPQLQSSSSLAITDGSVGGGSDLDSAPRHSPRNKKQQGQDERGNSITLRGPYKDPHALGSGSGGARCCHSHSAVYSHPHHPHHHHTSVGSTHTRQMRVVITAPSERAQSGNTASNSANNANNNNNSMSGSYNNNNNNNSVSVNSTGGAAHTQAGHHNTATTIIPVQDEKLTTQLANPIMAPLFSPATSQSSFSPSLDATGRDEDSGHTPSPAGPQLLLHGSVTTVPRAEGLYCISMPPNTSVESIFPSLRPRERSTSPPDGRTSPGSRDGGGAGASLSDPGPRCVLSMQVPLPPFLLSAVPPLTDGTPSAATAVTEAKIAFVTMHGRDTSTSVAKMAFPFYTAIAATYLFKHFQGRVYCLVKLRNVLRRTSLWMRGVLFDTAPGQDAPAYEVVRVSDTYSHLLFTEWKAGEAFDIMFELAVAPSYQPTEAIRHHQVQVKVFYSSWMSTYEKTAPAARLVLLPQTPPQTEAGADSVRVCSSAGSSVHEGRVASNPPSAEVIDELFSDEGAQPLGPSDPSSAVSAPFASRGATMTGVGSTASEGPFSRDLTHQAHSRSDTAAPGGIGVGSPSLHKKGANDSFDCATGNSNRENRSADGSSSRGGAEDAPFLSTAAIRYDPSVVEALARSCNTFLAPVATFQSTQLCLFSAVMYAESPWTMRWGASTNFDPSVKFPPRDKMPTTAAGSLTTPSRADDDRTATTTPLSTYMIDNSSRLLFGDKMIDQPSSYTFIAGEPVRFCVQLQPQAQNWPEDAGMEEDFFITLTYDATQWMVIGKQRERRTLSLLDNVTVYFTAVPLLPSVAAQQQAEGDAPLADDTASRAAGESANKGDVQLAGNTVADEGTLQTPTITMKWVSRQPHNRTNSFHYVNNNSISAGGGGSPAANNMVAGAEHEDRANDVPIDLVQFRRWVRVRKQLL